MKTYVIQLEIKTAVRFVAVNEEQAEKMARGKVSGLFKAMTDDFFGCQVTTHGVSELQNTDINPDGMRQRQNSTPR